MQDNQADNSRKTYKRELAFLLFIWLVYLVETKEPEIVQLLTFPIFTFGALAFGLQWYSPNGGLLGNQSFKSARLGTQRSSEYASREEQYPKSWHVERYRTEASETTSKDYQPDVRHEQGPSRFG
jgi:hypothetical protein